MTRTTSSGARSSPRRAPTSPRATTPTRSWSRPPPTRRRSGARSRSCSRSRCSACAPWCARARSRAAASRPASRTGSARWSRSRKATRSSSCRSRMPIHKYKPTSAGRRAATVLRNPELSGGAPEKSLTVTLRRLSGRNSYGRITSRRRGGGAKRAYRLIDWRRRHDGVPAKVAELQYDPYRSANIALLHYGDGRKAYIIAPLGLKAGDSVVSGPQAEPRVGNALPLARVPLGSEVHCVELEPGRGAKLGRSAGVVIRLASREGDYATVIMPSGEMRKVHIDCRATMGQVG